MKEPSTLKEKIYNLIMEDILSHQYSSQDVINEKDLVDKYGCSKTPIREALITLCDEHVLRSIPRYGYEVIRLTTDDVRSMIQYRYAVESGVLLAGMDRFGPNQLKALRDIDKVCSESTDVWEHWAHNTRFHTRMMMFAGNPYAADCVETCMNDLKRAYAQFCWDNVEPLPLSNDTKYHRDILSAFEKKDRDKALHFLKADLNEFAGHKIDTNYIP